MQNVLTYFLYFKNKFCMYYFSFNYFSYLYNYFLRQLKKIRENN